MSTDPVDSEARWRILTGGHLVFRVELLTEDILEQRVYKPDCHVSWNRKRDPLPAR
jgi:hypothetical protein